MSNEMMRKEMQEAIEAGERALRCLYSAGDKLSSAKNWGLLDLFGGGFITDLIKHSKMEDASRYMEEAKYELQRFQRELKDVSGTIDLRIDVGSFLSFADFFFDGLLADFMVHSKIADAKRQVEETARRVEHILAELKNQYRSW